MKKNFFRKQNARGHTAFVPKVIIMYCMFLLDFFWIFYLDRYT
jgi:hypothetical protein